jgi:aminoglycoside phosphotransferase (APT) family kinase protein
MSGAGGADVGRRAESRRFRKLVPTEDELVAVLTSWLGKERLDHEVMLLERRRNDFGSSHPAEIVRCRIDGEQMWLLCKYEMREQPPSFGHRRGVGFEADVYRELLEPLGLRTPRLRGSAVRGGAAWLFVEYVDGVRANEVASPALALQAAARWAGHFHADSVRRLEAGELGFLPVHDARYFAQWPQRLGAIAGEWHDRLPWLAALCEELEKALAELAGIPATAIHGEFTPHNLIAPRDGEICPVDWESAAIAPGEIDLATLIQGWPEDVAATCEREYVATRWPGGAPANFARRLDLARAYWELRWLGDRPEWLAEPKLYRRFDELGPLGVRLGLPAAATTS